MRIASVAKRVLFIGNSLTFWNQGVDVMLAKLVPGIETERVAVGGATLETLWANDEARLACAATDVVVLRYADAVVVFCTQTCGKIKTVMRVDRHAAGCAVGVEREAVRY